tara:strand:- start:7478 stop:7744 length:267 start_codon:yes stop_codon:yes gene_type:complete
MLRIDDLTLRNYKLINFSQLSNPEYSKYKGRAKVSQDKSLAIIKDLEIELEDGWTNLEITSYLSDNRILWNTPIRNDYPEDYDPIEDE